MQMKFIITTTVNSSGSIRDSCWCAKDDSVTAAEAERLPNRLSAYS